MTTDYKGIDYGLGHTNIDHETGIHYGVIPANDVLRVWADSCEEQYEYGDAQCPKCGNIAIDVLEFEEQNPDIAFYSFEHAKYTTYEYVCKSCEYVFGDSVKPISYTYERDGYSMEQGVDDTEIFITKSPYFTYAQFCSPCAPGAGYLRSDLTEKDENNKTYCLGHDWFGEQETGQWVDCEFFGGTGYRNGTVCWSCQHGDVSRAPYTVYSVKTGEVVEP